MDFALMNSALIKRTPCSVCGIETHRRIGWFLVVENRWLDRLKILSWHSSLARQKNMKSVCCREHLKMLLAHWLTRASLRPPSFYDAPMPIGSDASLKDVDLSPDSAGRLLGELAVHRESFSRGWSGSATELESILDALIAKTEPQPRDLGYQHFDLRPEPSHGISLQ